MTAFLRFTMFAPLASWGDVTVGEVRSSWDQPSRSAILGLVAAAFGITRDDATALATVDASLGVGVRVLAGGQRLLDYHTTQNPSASVARRRAPSTRRSALATSEPETALSRRELRQDALYLVALWPRPGATRALDEVAQALRRPAFTLYAGRKANAIGLPLAPEVISAGSLAEALAAVPRLPEELEVLRRKRTSWGIEVAHDECDNFPHGLQAVLTRTRRDAEPARGRWQFAERVVRVGRIPGEA